MAGQPSAGKQEKELPNIVHQNAIFRETIHKEQRHQKLYTNYGVNPYKKSSFKSIMLQTITCIMLLVFVLAGKPNSTHDSADGEDDGKTMQDDHNSWIYNYQCFNEAEFLRVYHNATKTPKDKYMLPQTAAQEIGWDITPLVWLIYKNCFFNNEN